ncbi:MAG: ABC transporter permease, partial [Acidobacteriota bacterium]
MIDAMLQDLRYALRTLGKARAFSAVAVLTLGLGIGANTAIFSVVNAVLLRPLPFEAADRLVFVRGELRARDVYNWPISPRILLDMRERGTLIDAFAGIATASGTMVAGEGEPVQLQQGLVTPNLFRVLHVAPVRGRDFTDDDAAPIPDGTDPTNVPPSAAILSHRLWEQRFGSDPAIVGRTIEFNGNDVEVIGIMPAGFKLLLAPDAYASANVDVWLAPRLDLVNFDRRQAMFDVVGRLADGVTVAQAQSEMDALAEWEREINEASAGAGYGLRVVPMQQEITANVQPVVLALLGAVGFVLLIACANVS